MRWLFLSAALLAAACKTAEPVPGATGENYTPKGEIQFQGVGASWDDSRVVGPSVNMTLRTDGSWGGTLRGEGMDVSVYASRAAGVNFTLSWENTGDGMVATGQWQGVITRFETTGDRLLIRTPRHSMTVTRHDESSFGPNGEVVAKGQAGLKNPPMPQFGLALMSAF
jgi:hypothetical protein